MKLRPGKMAPPPFVNNAEISFIVSCRKTLSRSLLFTFNVSLYYSVHYMFRFVAKFSNILVPHELPFCVEFIKFQEHAQES